MENKENAVTTLPFEDSLPDWFDGKRINEVLFCQQFLDKHPMKCVRGRLFTVDGLIEDEGQIGNLILEEISSCLTSGLSKVVANLLASIKLQAYSPPLPIETDRIHVANGTYFMDGRFSADKSYCNNRLTVSYKPDASVPNRWLQFLSELLVPEDIPTLQEYLGYCLLPTTKGQKMLMLIGKGGEGKSRIGLVMRSLLGDSMNTTSIQKVESNRFSRADLENKLLMVDDDMDMSALPKTNYIKSIVTSECKMDMERKGVQSYQSQLYVRFLCFGNGALTALHDKSDGFFRRQIVLTTIDRPAGRADDPFLVDKLLREKEGIFLWCLEGLHRLIGNNYQFSISGKARENMETVKRSSNNVIEFLQSEGYIRFRADGDASSKAIYEAYTRWCDDNAQKPMSANRVSSELAQNERLYNVEATNNVHVGGKRVRGFMGIEVVKLFLAVPAFGDGILSAVAGAFRMLVRSDKAARFRFGGQQIFLFLFIYIVGILLLPALSLCCLELCGGEAPFLAVSDTEVFLLRLVLPTPLFVQRAHGQQNMSVGILSVRVVDGSVGAHTLCHKLLLNIFLNKGNLRLPVKLSRQCCDELPRKAAVLGLFVFLHGVPELFSVLPFLRSVFRQKYLLPDKPLLFRVVVLYPVVIVIQTGAAHIGGSGHGGAPCAPADHLRLQMIDRQTFSFPPTRGH